MTEKPNQSSVTHLPYKDMIKARTKAWREQYDRANRPRMNESVTLTFRKRGDYFGRLLQTQARSQWRSFDGSGMVTYPVISRTIRSKTATSVSTRIQTDIEAIRDLPEKQAGAELAKNICKFFRNTQRTKSFESELAENNQIHRFSFIYNDFQMEGGAVLDVPVSKPKAVKQGATEYVCANCGFNHAPEDLGISDVADNYKDSDIAKQLQSEYGTGDSTDSMNSAPAKMLEAANEADEIDDGDEKTEMSADSQSPDVLNAQIINADGFEYDNDGDEDPNIHNCPECGEKSVYLNNRARWEQIIALTGEYERADTGKLHTKIISPLLLRIDAYRANGFNYKDADWFCFHPLVPAYELCRIAPHLEDRIKGGEFSNWSESARWHYELSVNASSVSGTGYSHHGRDYHLDELVEIEIWYIKPRACYGWESPENYDDNSGFTIQKGETLADAWARQSPDGKFNGQAVIMIGRGETAEVVASGNEFFTEKWVGVPWKIDAQSFYPQGEENLLKLQDAATNVLSMAYSHVRRMSVPQKVVNGMMFDKNDVDSNQTGQIVWTKQTTAELQDQDWRKYIGYLQPADLSASVYQLIQYIIEIAKEESGVFNETVGNVENTETLGGREMALTQSLGLMTPTQQAKAVAFIEQEYIWLELVQKFAPDEFFLLIKGTFEEEWKPQDVEAFRALDIRNELFVTIVEGTDIPKTQTEMEQRFMVAVQMGLFTEPNPLPLQIRSHIVKSVLGIDFDISNYGAFKRLAARRYENLKKELAGLMPNDVFTIILDPVTQFPTRTLRPEIVASIAQDPHTAPRGTDEHLTFIEYYTDQINGLVGATDIDEVLIAALDKEIDMHRAYLAASSAQASAAQGVIDNSGASVVGAQSGAMMSPQGQPGQNAPAGM